VGEPDVAINVKLQRIVIPVVLPVGVMYAVGAVPQPPVPVEDLVIVPSVTKVSVPEQPPEPETER